MSAALSSEQPMTRFLWVIGWISLAADLVIAASIISAQKGIYPQ